MIRSIDIKDISVLVRLYNCYLQMQKTFFILLVLVSNLMFSQGENGQLEFRKLSGNLVDEDGQPFPGQTVMIKGTEIGTVTDFDGNFCLVVPKEKILFIELPFCFDQIFREIKPTDDNVGLKIGREKRKTRKSHRNWNKVEMDLKAELNKIFKSTEYQSVRKSICR